MEFRTQIPITKSKNPIDYKAKIVSLGSCFVENIGDKFSFYKFQNTNNPFGIIFNPVSIESMIYRIVNQNYYPEKDIFFHNERWHSFEVHSDWSHANKGEFLANLNAKLKLAKQQLQEASHIIITYGTSWVYRNIATQEIVANCHKVPQNEFIKEIISVEVIEKSMQNTLGLIQKINPNVNFIFTVSPVRHLKDGFVENQVSKAHLITAIHQILKSEIWKLKSATYFPSYEIMMDELRDYRFYAQDMIHPNPVAIDYIWKRFSESNISPETHSIMKEIETIQKGLAHRPFDLVSKGHQQFLSKLNDKILIIQNQFPDIHF